MRYSAWLLFLLLAHTPCVTAYANPRQEQSAQPPASSQPDPPGVYQVGGGVTAPKVLHTEELQYSKEARKKKVEGVCLLSLIVGPDGAPRDIKVRRSISAGLAPKLQAAGISLDEKAKEAVQHYRFQPGMLNGQPVPVKINIEVNFQLY